MKNVLLGLLLTLIILPLIFLVAIIITRIYPDDPTYDQDIVVLIALPLALLTLTIIGWIQKWGRVRLLLSILIGPLLLLMIRLTSMSIDNWLQPAANPSRLPLAIALDVIGIFSSFFAVSYLYLCLSRKLSR